MKTRKIKNLLRPLSLFLAVIIIAPFLFFNSAISFINFSEKSLSVAYATSTDRGNPPLPNPPLPDPPLLRPDSPPLLPTSAQDRDNSNAQNPDNMRLSEVLEPSEADNGLNSDQDNTGLSVVAEMDEKGVTPEENDFPGEEISEINPDPDNNLAAIESQEAEDYVNLGNNAQNSTSTDPDTAITTNDSLAVGNVINDANSTAINSQGAISLKNFLDNVEEDIVIFKLEEIGTGTTSPGTEDYSQVLPAEVSPGETEPTQSEVRINNAAVIENNLNIIANTGENRAKGLSSALITTGDATAIANVLNIANTNFIDSNYSFTIANVLGNLDGDLLLPGKKFWENHLPLTATTAPAETINIYNENKTENNIISAARTGNNSASRNGEIETGNATSISNVLNITNTNLINSDYLLVLVKVEGNWEGRILSVPEGFLWEKTDEGAIIYSEEVFKTLFKNIDSLEDPAFQPTSCEPDICKPLSAEINNDATIINNVNVTANTGENTARGRESSHIKTGDATAISNIVNITNTNVIGSNWITALINVLGDWNGNIAFGRPDIWVGTRAEIFSDPLTAGSLINFIINIENKGDADATQLQIKTEYNRSDLITLDSETLPGADFDAESIIWTLPSLQSGSSTTLTYSATVLENLPYGLHSLNTTTTVTLYEKDANESDNFDFLSLNIQGPIPPPPPEDNSTSSTSTLPIPPDDDGNSTSSPPEDANNGNDGQNQNTGGGNSGNPSAQGGGSGGSSTPYFSLIKTSSPQGLITPGTTVSYKIVVKNTRNELINNVVVYDILRGPSGIVSRNSWELGQVEPYEEIIIEYDTNFISTAPRGAYTNSAFIKANNFAGQALPDYGIEYNITIGDSFAGSDNNNVNNTAELIQTSASTASENINNSVSTLVNLSDSKEPVFSLIPIAQAITEPPQENSAELSADTNAQSADFDLTGQVAGASTAKKTAVQAQFYSLSFPGLGWILFVLALLLLILLLFLRKKREERS